MELDAERAAVEHWRRVARQRSEELAALRNRLPVRVLLGVERRLEPVVSGVGSARRRVRAAAERLALSTGALRRGAGRRTPPATPGVPAPAPSSGEPPPTARPAAIVVVGAGRPAWLDALPAGVDVVGSPAPSGTRAAIAAAVAASDPGVVGIVHAAAEPLTPDWLERLVAAVDGSAVAAVPVLVHPHRPLRRARRTTVWCGRPGWGCASTATVRRWRSSLDAGAAPRPGGATVDVTAGSGAALVVDRTAYEAVGGLAPGDDLDAAAVELCVRLRAAGGRVVLVPGAVVVDHRPVRTRRELRFAVDPS